MERKKNKLKTWLKSFNVEQKMLWESTIISEIEKNDRVTTLILDACYMAAISSTTDLELIDIERIVAESTTYIQDYKNKIEKGDAIGMTISQSSAIKSKIRLLIKANKEKVQSIKELEKEYKIPFAELDVMWLQVKSKMGIVNKRSPKKAIAEEEVKEVLEDIAADKEEKKVAEELSKNMKKVFSKEELPYAVTEKEIEEGQKETKAPSTLKIISQTIKGEYGTYEKSSEGVKTDKIFVKDAKDLEEYKNAVQGEYDKSGEELNKRFKELQEEKEKLIKKADKNFAIIEEIKQVFNI